MLQPPFVLTIAGHDPSAGAGVTSDIKTFEQHKVYGLSVITAITVQNDYDFVANHPIDIDLILHQIKVLMSAYEIEVVKIGLINGFRELKDIVSLLKRKNPDIKIIWDPIIKSSSGFNFHRDLSINNEVLKDFFLITPNIIEYEYFEKNGIDLQQFPCLLKGGHHKNKLGTDFLIIRNQKIKIEGKPFDGKTKHGTGCVLSSAIAANIAKGVDIEKACVQAKRYVEEFILSNESNLGFHQIIKQRRWTN